MAGARLFGSEFDRANGSRLRVLHRRNTSGRRFFLTGVRLFGRHPRRSGLVLTRSCSFAREETLESLGEALELAHGTNTFESNPKRGWRAKSSAFRLYRSSLGNLESRLFSRTLPLKKNRSLSRPAIPHSARLEADCGTDRPVAAGPDGVPSPGGPAGRHRPTRSPVR